MAATVSEMLSLRKGAIEALWAKVRKDWLISEVGCADWFETVRDRRRQLEDYLDNHPQLSPLVLIAESDSATFLASFWAALLTGWNVALANPHWGSREWQSVDELICPDIIWSDRAKQLNFSGCQQPELSPSTILIPTGGSSGKVKFAYHTQESLMASISGFRQRFTPKGEPVSTYCVLPVYHVSGLMQVLRAWISGGQVVIATFKQLEADPPTQLISPQSWFISLVPTQLERLIQSGKGTWLSQFRCVFLGGAPPWPSLLDRAMALNIPLCLSYGMTETAAMVTALSPEEFLNGKRSSGRSLLHATIQIIKNGQPLPPQEAGQITILSAALARSSSQDGIFYTDDLGYLDTDGHLHITGRASNKIISGGENIFPAEVEAALRSTGQVKDVCVLGLPHSQWGEVVVSAYVPTDATVSSDSLKQALSGTTTQTLSRYKHPKYWIALTTLPRNAQGKLNRQALMEQIAHQSNLSTPPLADGAFSFQ